MFYVDFCNLFCPMISESNSSYRTKYSQGLTKLEGQKSKSKTVYSLFLVLGLLLFSSSPFCVPFVCLVRIQRHCVTMFPSPLSLFPFIAPFFPLPLPFLLSIPLSISLFAYRVDFLTLSGS